MTGQYAIRHEIAELLGPLRCQRCASRNAECFVKARSEHCFRCQSDWSECTFTRMVERSGGMDIFSWEELLGEKESTKALENYGNTSRPNLSQSVRENSSDLRIGRSRQEADLWAPPPYPRAASPTQQDLPYHADFPLPHAFTSAWLPPSATPRRRYSSSVASVSSETISRQAQSLTADVRGLELPMLESPYGQDHRSVNGHSVATNPLMAPPGSLPSIRDTLSNIDPRITSPKPGSTRTWPLVKPNSSTSTFFTSDDSETSDRAQSSAPSEISDPISLDFVLETFNTTSGSMESRRGKRRGKLSESSASSASRLRSVGACWKCKLQKNQCSTEDPCGPCRKLLETKKYRPPCFRGPLSDLVPEIFWNEIPKPRSTYDVDFSKALLPGARDFLSNVKRHNSEMLKTALKLYESVNEPEMQELCSSVLKKLETSLNRSRHLSQAEFFAICILDLVSRAAEMAATHLTAPNDRGLFQAVTYPKPGSYFKRSKSLEVLFSLIRPTSDYSPFQAISKATCSRPYDRVKDGMDLLTHVERCLFNIKPFPIHSPQNIENLQMHISSASSPDLMSLPAMTLPDRSTPEAGRKRGLSAESEAQTHKSRLVTKQRLAMTGLEAPAPEAVAEVQRRGED